MKKFKIFLLPEKYKLPFFVISVVIIFDLITFLMTYFNWSIQILLDFDISGLIHLLASIAAWIKFPVKLIWKILIIVGTSLITMLIWLLLVFSTMFLPGSREHNHIMYDVCLPAMRKYYGIKEGEGFPISEGVDKEGNGLWWYQHLECEDNVWAGKGPIFSENPKDFKPVKN